MHSETSEQSIRAGTFATLAAADRAVARLIATGFTSEEINVVCSDEAREAHFQQFRHQEPAGKETSGAVGTGVSVGAALGGLTALALGAATGTVPLFIAGATGLSAGSAMGGFLGAMLTRGGERELSNYYDQEVRQGRILVAVDVRGPQAAIRRAQAGRLLADSGANPVPLPEG
jgi:hypothetical protein